MMPIVTRLRKTRNCCRVVVCVERAHVIAPSFVTLHHQRRQPCHCIPQSAHLVTRHHHHRRRRHRSHRQHHRIGPSGNVHHHLVNEHHQHQPRQVNRVNDQQQRRTLEESRCRKHHLAAVTQCPRQLKSLCHSHRRSLVLHPGRL